MHLGVPATACRPGLAAELTNDVVQQTCTSTASSSLQQQLLHKQPTNPDEMSKAAHRLAEGACVRASCGNITVVRGLLATDRHTQAGRAQRMPVADQSDLKSKIYTATSSCFQEKYSKHELRVIWELLPAASQQQQQHCCGNKTTTATKQSLMRNDNTSTWEAPPGLPLHSTSTYP
jgi:hypothetical protein